MTDTPRHHRLVIAIETTAVAVSYVDLFKNRILEHAFHYLESLSCEVTIVTFSALDGTARSCLTATPWTKELGAVKAWVDAIPALLEGTGYVAALEAVSEAMSMLEQPSLSTPQEGHKIVREIMMLWLSEAQVSSPLIAGLDQHKGTTHIGFKLPLALNGPDMAFSVFTTNQLGSKRSLARIDAEYNKQNQEAGGGKGMFASQLCSFMPELVANVARSSCVHAVCHAALKAMRMSLSNDPEMQRQQKLAAATLRARPPAPVPTSKVARIAEDEGQATEGSAVAPRSAPESAVPNIGVSEGSTRQGAHTAGSSMASSGGKQKLVSWRGNISASTEFEYSDLLSTTAEMSASLNDTFLLPPESAPPPSTWPATIELVGFMTKTSQFRQAVGSMDRKMYGKVLVNFDEHTMHNLFTKRSADVVVLSLSNGYSVVIPQSFMRVNPQRDRVQVGLYMADSTRVAFFSQIQRI